MKRFACEVIGLLQSKGQGGFGMDADDTIVMPLRTVQRQVRGKDDVSGLRLLIEAVALASLGGLVGMLAAN